MENYKLQASNDKQSQSTNDQYSKHYDLEDRTLTFARRINEYVKELSRTVSNQENGRQLIRSAGSVGANYIEANEVLSKKDFGMRIKISRKEAKESRFWLHLTEPATEALAKKAQLITEATELTKIFSSILLKCGFLKF